jgi:hypothetical protein
MSGMTNVEEIVEKLKGEESSHELINIIDDSDEQALFAGKKRNWKPQNKTKTKDMSNLKCYGCNKMGHMKRDCKNGETLGSVRFFDRVGESLGFLSLGSELCFKRGDFRDKSKEGFFRSWLCRHV